MAEIIKTVIDVDINTSGAAAELRSLQQQINAFNLTLNKGQLEQGQASRVFAEGLKNSINTGGFFRAELVKMQTAAGALDSTLRKGQGTLGQFFSASFNKKGGMAAEVFALAAERARTMQTQFIATAKASKGMQEALAVRPLTAFSADAAVSAQRMQILNSMFKQGTTGLINFGKNVQWTGRQLMVGFTIPLTIFGTTAGRVFSDLEKQAVNFKKVYGDIFTTPAELQENFKAVQGLSREFTKYGIAAKDTLSLAAQAAAAGRQNTDLTDAVRESTRLATLGQMDQNAALETTISLQSAFRLSGQELADTINFLNMVENQTVVSLQDIAAAIPRVAPVIKGLGGDVKDLTVFLAAMQEGGVSAEQGANALKSGLGSLINPTKAATDVLAGFKINLDSIIQTNRGDLMGTVMAFSDALSTLDEFSRQQALESIFGKFQYARLGALFENISREGSQAQQVISTLGYSTEQLAKSAEKELSTVEQAFSVQLTGAIERLKIAIAPLGEIFVKMAIPLVNMVTKIVDAFNRLPEGVKNVAALATVLGGVLLPAATMIFGLFANLIGTFAKFTHSMGMFGVTLLRKGPLAAIKSLTQSANYLSLSEIDAANAARQLGSATELANAALLSQVGSANSADVAIKNLTNSYRVLISEQTRASQAQSFLFGTGQAASNLGKGSAAASVATTIATRGKSRIKAVGLNKGGSVFTPDYGSTVPGVGNTDKVPAMLTPGEFVVNKESTKNNLGLLHSINAQRLNVGGKVKNGIQYAMSGFLIGNTPGYSAATNAVAAKLARSSQATRTRGTAAKTSNKAEQLKNNFVYLLNPSNNQQLTGVRTMKEFDKRGVPLDVLKQDMVSEEGLWMIDALAKGNWKKDAYKSTLENNFANIAAKYPGKEIRFLDSAGLERVQPLLGKPEYQNVQFVSVKDLQNKELLDNLTPDHLQSLMTEATQVSKKLRTSKSRGTTSVKDTYEGIPGMESYTKIQENWRGARRPAGRHGAHMYNMGGKVEGMQYFGTKEKNRVVKDNRKKVPISQHYAFDTVALSGSDAANFNRQMNVLYNISREMSKVDKSSLPLYMQADNLPLNANHAKQLLDILTENNISPKKFPAVFSFLQNAVNNPNEYNQRILNGLIASNKESLVEKGITQSEANKQAKFNLFNSLKGQQGVKINTYQEALDALSSLDDHTSTEFLTKRIKQGSIKKVSLGKGYSEAKARVGRYASGKTSIPGKTRLHMTTPMMMMTMLGLNEGGMIPGVQYAMSGKLIKDSMRAPFGVPAWGPNKSSSVAKGSWGSLMEGITTRRKYDWDKIPIETLKPGMTAGRRTSGTRPLNVEIYDPITKKTIGQYDVDPTNATEKRSLLNTLQVEKSKGFKEAYIRAVGEGFNKGGMIPGVQYANIGKMIGKAMGLNADDALGAFGLLKPAVRSGGKTKIPKNLTMKEIFEHKEFKEGIYLVQPQGGKAYEASLYYFNGKPRLQRHGQYNVGSGIGTQTRQFDPIDVDPNMRASIYNRNEYTGSNVSGPFKANKGSIVPGSGNTDTVPAMLTPGEFVINKKSTKQNYDLLTAINNGQNLNVGGKVKGYAIGGVVAQNLLPMIGMMGGQMLGGEGMMGMISSLGGMMAGTALASKMARPKVPDISGDVAETGKALKGISKVLAPLRVGILGTTLGFTSIAGGLAALVIGFVALRKMAQDAVQSGGELINSMYGSSERMKEFAKAFGRENTQQALQRQRAETVSGGRIGSEAQQFSSQFIQSGAGAQLLKDAEAAQKVGGKAGRDEAILNQLTRGVVTGSITAEEAKAIALDIGTKLNDQSLGIRISGQISKLVGPNGEDIADNMLAINAQINPIFDISKLEDIVKKQYENLGFFQKAGMKMFRKDTEDMLVDSLAEGAIQAKDITKEQIDFLKLELQNGNISYQEFVTKRNQIAMQSVNASEGAIEQINKRFGQGTDEAEKRIRQFRKEFEKEFQLNIKTDLGKKDAGSVNEFLNQFEKGGVKDTFVAGGKGGSGVIQAKKVNTPATEALKLLESETLLAMSLIEDRDGANKKLEEIYAKDPAILTILDDYVAQGGDLEKLLSKDIGDIEKYKDSLDKLAAVPAKLKEGVDIDRLIGDPDKLNAFIEETGKVKGILDEIKKNKNLSISAKMKLVADKFGKDSPMYKLLVEGQKKGLSIETLLGFGVTDKGKKVAQAYDAIAKANAAGQIPPAWATSAIVGFESEGAADLKASQEGAGDGAKSALQSAKDAARQTKESIAAQSKLVAAGISVEALEGLSPEAIIELSKQSGKELRNNIKLFNEQAESIKINKLALEQLALEENPVKKALEDSKKIVEGYDDQIKELNKTIEKSNRADELDRRRIEDKNKALENLTKKEKNVNDQYNERIKALDKVANANDRVAEKQRQQIDLASALTSGDIAGAAKAAAAMTETDAQYQIEDTKTALEAQRQTELDGLTESVNGKLMTRKDIQAEIDSIEERIYQRGINLRTTNDAIYGLQQNINTEKERQDKLNEVLKVQEEQLTKKALDKLKNEQGITAEKKKQTADAIKQVYAEAGGQKKTGKTLAQYQKDVLGLAFGGTIKKYAYGGNVGYRGSTEAPPALKMAMGSIVPGLGNTDRVPALLTPGEFVVRKSVAQANMPLLKALNSDVFPSMSLNTPDVAPTVTSSTSTILNNTPVYNYSISVNVPNTTASPDEIANVVVSRIKRSMDTNIRSNRY